MPPERFADSKAGVFYPGPWLAGGTERHLLGLALALATECSVEILSFSEVPWRELSRAFGLDLSSLRFKTVPEMPSHKLATYTTSYGLWVNGSPWCTVPSRSPKNIYLVVYPPLFRSQAVHRLRHTVAVGMQSALKAHLLRRSVSCISPSLLRRIDETSSTPPQEAIASYQVIVANSQFTRALIRRRWGRESQVLYPPVVVEAFPPLAKRQMILSVGRFGRGGNNKKHLALIEAFRNLVDQGFHGWELHLAGSTHDDPWNRIYFNHVTQAASGYPVFIHTNIGCDALTRLYGQSTIYWHGTGYGEDERRNPLGVEHFGIATVEAMAAGCIPIVCGKGGQPEIVSHGVHGFLWNRLDELQLYTRTVADSPALAVRLRGAASERSRQFGMEPFVARVREILGGLGYPRLAHSGRH